MKNKLPALLLILTAGAVQAERAWHGEGDFAYNKASGNTDTEVLMAELEIVYQRDRWTHTGGIEALNSSEDGERSAESYTLREKSDFALSDRRYVFGAGRYRDDRFSGYEYQASLRTGMGVHLIKSDRTILDLEGGVGYRRSKEHATDQEAGDTLNEAILTAAAVYQYQLTETTRFESDFSMESGQDNTYLEGEVAVKVKINSRLALKVGYKAEHNTDVPEGTEKTDTFTSVGLNYSF
jgi:putative salt-induced outer membrane protein